jgi:hypothetical protein
MSLEADSLAALEAARMRVIAQTERARTAAHDAAKAGYHVALLDRAGRIKPCSTSHREGVDTPQE